MIVNAILAAEHSGQFGWRDHYSANTAMCGAKEKCSSVQVETRWNGACESALLPSDVTAWLVPTVFVEQFLPNGAIKIPFTPIHFEPAIKSKSKHDLEMVLPFAVIGDELLQPQVESKGKGKGKCTGG